MVSSSHPAPAEPALANFPTNRQADKLASTPCNAAKRPTLAYPAGKPSACCARLHPAPALAVSFSPYPGVNQETTYCTRGTRPPQRQPPPAEPAPPTRAGCLFSPYPRNRRTMPPLRSPPDLTPPLAHLYPAAPLLRPALTALPGGKPKTHPPAEPVPAAPAPPASANVHTSSHPTAPGESPPERNVVSSSHPPFKYPATRGTRTTHPRRLPPNPPPHSAITPQHLFTPTPSLLLPRGKPPPTLQRSPLCYPPPPVSW